MPATAAGRELTQQHQRRQDALRAGTLRDFSRLWPLWEGDRASFDRMVSATATLVRSRHRDSAGLASDYLRALRTAEEATEDFVPQVAARVDGDRVASSLHVTARHGARKAIEAGQTPTQARQTALVRASGAVARHTLDGGRETLMGAVRSDPAAHGYIRTTGANPCAFCAMLASRPPVYKAESFSESDGRFSGGMGVGGPGDFKVHDHCNCGVAPVYNRSAPLPERNQRFQELWEQTAGQVPKGPYDRATLQRQVFRRAYEGRA